MNEEPRAEHFGKPKYSTRSSARFAHSGSSYAEQFFQEALQVEWRTLPAHEAALILLSRNGRTRKQCDTLSLTSCGPHQDDELQLARRTSWSAAKHALTSILALPTGRFPPCSRFVIWLSCRRLPASWPSTPLALGQNLAQPTPYYLAQDDTCRGRG